MTRLELTVSLPAEDDAEVDAVYIATPTHLHTQHVLTTIGGQARDLREALGGHTDRWRAVAQPTCCHCPTMNCTPRDSAAVIIRSALTERFSAKLIVAAQRTGMALRGRD